MTLKQIFYMYFPPKLHWYQIRVLYSKGGKQIFSYNMRIGRVKQSDIIEEREIKKSLSPLNDNPLLKPHLCNGLLAIEVVCYLGRFKNK